MRSMVRTTNHRLCLAVSLKCFQRLHHFPELESVPETVINHLRQCLQMNQAVEVRYDRPNTMYRHRQLIRDWLEVQPYHDNIKARRIAASAALRASAVLDDPVDIVNAMIEELQRESIELPAYSTLDRFAGRAHAAADRRLFRRTMRHISGEQRQALDQLLTVEFERSFSAFQTLKASAKKATLSHLAELLSHLEWLESLGNIDAVLAEVPPAKRRAFANEAKALDASELKDYSDAQRCTLILCMIHRARVQTRDEITEMFLRRMATIHKRAKDELHQIHLEQRERTERLVETLDSLLTVLSSQEDDHAAAAKMRTLVGQKAEIEALRNDCAAIRAWSNNNYLPLLGRHYRSHRQVLLKVLRSLRLEASTADDRLLNAVAVILDNAARRPRYLEPDEIDLAFASDRWKKLVLEQVEGEIRVDRRQLEVCAFSYLMAELRSGDITVWGTESFADYRDQLLPMEQCRSLFRSYCEGLELPKTASEFVAHLKGILTETAQRVDSSLLANDEVSINSKGEPVVRRTRARAIPASAVNLQATIVQRMPVRNLLDVLANVEHWTNFTRHFNPASGSDPKLDRAVERYILTVFALGCNLGPAQAARHMAGLVSSHTLSFINQRHMSVDKLDASRRELIELYLQLELPKVWGDGKTVAADGTQYDFYEQNLLAGYHFRYRKMGAVAYRHVADNYIAYFAHFLPPGIKEAVYVIEGLMKSRLSILPDAVHSDTHGQTTTVFAFTYLLGIKLMPRIRNWKDLLFFRPSKDLRFRHIESLFSNPVDWALIERHWEHLMQMVLSIHAGKISSAMLLRRLGCSSEKNKLFLVTQEVGRVIRTIYLLEWIANGTLRRQVTATTNIIESYNAFAKWLAFGGEGVIAENDPDEQQKRLRYNDLVASAVILHNVVDMSRILAQLKAEGYNVRDEDRNFLSPHLTGCIKRFGDYTVNMAKPPEPWLDDQVPPRKGPNRSPNQAVLPFVREA
jgi:TnpA family transposase